MKDNMIYILTKFNMDAEDIVEAYEWYQDAKIEKERLELIEEEVLDGNSYFIQSVPYKPREIW